MEIEKTLQLPAAPDRIWQILLDPKAMAACVPGMESVEVLSDTEYFALMKVKIAFISAKFKLKTRIVEMDAPNYLRAEGTGEDASVASSLKQTSEMWIRQVDEENSELRIKVAVTLLGRMGTFGLSIMQTKADRIWSEFGENLAATLTAPVQEEVGGAQATVTKPEHAVLNDVDSRLISQLASILQANDDADLTPARPITSPSAAKGVRTESMGWVSKLFGRCNSSAAASDYIRLNYQNGAASLALEWPVSASDDCRRLALELAKACPVPEKTGG